MKCQKMLIVIVFFFLSDSSYKALCISMICVVLYCTVVLSLRTQVEFW